MTQPVLLTPAIYLLFTNCTNAHTITKCWKVRRYAYNPFFQSKIYANINILILQWISVKKENFFLGDKSCPIKTSRFPLIYKLYKCTHGYKMFQS